MAKYVPTVGGWKWNQALVDIRQRNQEAMGILDRLLGAATTDATKVLVLSARLKLTENQVDVSELLKMKGGDEANGE